MKKLLILLSLTLTVSLAETTTKKTEVKVTPQNSSHIETKEVHTSRIASEERKVRSERTIRFSRLVRVLRTSRASRHVVKTPTTHIASVK